MKNAKLHLLILIGLLPFLHGCTPIQQNPNRPILLSPITIYPNTLQYQELNFISGWLYITADVESTSRGIIVYRQSETEFLAYDRMPPNEPDACTDSHGNTTRMVVDFLNGQIIIREPDMIPSFPTDGTAVYPLIQYHTSYDGSRLTITN